MTFTKIDQAYLRSDAGGTWLVERLEDLQADDGPPSYSWQVAANAEAGSISAVLPSDPMEDEVLRAYLEAAPPIEAGPLACSGWFARLEAMTGGAALVMDRWLKVPLLKSEATDEQITRRSAFHAAASQSGWMVDSKHDMFDGGIAVSPDVLADRGRHQLGYFVRSNMIEAFVGGIEIRMLAPADFVGSLRSLEPLIERGGKGAVDWIEAAGPLHEVCMLRTPDGDWARLEKR